MNYVELAEVDKKLAELDVKLAILLGYEEVGIRKNPGKCRHLVLARSGSTRSAIPRWTKDNSAVFTLAVDYGINISDSIFINGFNDKYEAHRVAIVKEVIELLETKL